MLNGQWSAGIFNTSSVQFSIDSGDPAATKYWPIMELADQQMGHTAFLFEIWKIMESPLLIKIN